MRLLAGDLAQGALAGVMTDAVARAAGVPLADVRRALMLSGDLPGVAAIALAEGREGLAAVGLRVGPAARADAGGDGERPRRRAGARRPAAVDWKLDGVRVQVHRAGDEVAVFTRTLDDVTARVPELVAVARGLDAETLVLDGEAIALRRGWPARSPSRTRPRASARAAAATSSSASSPSTCSTSTAAT